MDRRRCFGRQAASPMITPKIIAELDFRPAVELHVLQPAVADQPAARLEDHREEAVTVSLLVVEVTPHPAFHLDPIEGLDAERGHHRWIAEHAEQVIDILGPH